METLKVSGLLEPYTTLCCSSFATQETGESGSDFKRLNDQDLFFITQNGITLLCTWKFIWGYFDFCVELSVICLTRDLVFCLSG